LKLKKLRPISSRSISEKVKGRHFLEDLGVDGKMILKRILSSGECGLDSSIAGWGIMTGCCKHLDEHTGS